MKKVVKPVDIDPSWLGALKDEFEQPYMAALREFLQAEKAAKKVIFPASKWIFNAFNATPFHKVKVVILGQDPYHGPGQAHGLCFSVLAGVRTPPSLMNIFKEIQRDVGCGMPSSGCLQAWAEQGVLLLNATLTVEQGRAGSHQGKGWEVFTDKVIAELNQQQEGLVFLLWGAYAQKKGALINSKKHCVLQSAHPSPLSAHRGFLGNQHFSKTNSYLQQQGKAPIDWALAKP